MATAAALQFNTGTPVAQVTVIDGKYGDSNLVDFCRLPFSTNNADQTGYYEDSWRRTLIDTGPPAKPLLRTLAFLIENQQLPKTASGTTNPGIPKLARLTITHLDEDHIGNASELLETLKDSDKIKQAQVAYSHFPKAVETPVIDASAPAVSREHPGLNEITFSAKLTTGWKELMEKCGVDVDLTFEVKDSDATRSKYKLEWHTLPDLLSYTLHYPKEASSKSSEVTKYSPKLLASIALSYESRPAADITLTTTPKNSITYVKVKEYLYKVNVEIAIESGFKKRISQTPVMSSQAAAALQNNSKVGTKSGDSSSSDFNLDWVDPPKKSTGKRSTSNPTVFARGLTMIGSPAHVQSIRAIRAIRAATAATAEGGGSSNPEEDAGDEEAIAPFQILNYQHAITLRKTIATLNTQSQNPPSTPSLDPIVLQQGDIAPGPQTRPPNVGCGREITLGPSERAFQDLMRPILLAHLKTYGDHAPEDIDIETSSEQNNRSSTVSMFEVPVSVLGQGSSTSSGSPGPGKISLLFTGDAYDQPCDIRETVQQWNIAQNDKTQLEKLIIDVNVLKVPHHGSSVTTDVGFWKYVRAEVYIICGTHVRNIHGNPRVKTLKAIVTSIRNRKLPNGNPVRIFFSSTEIMDDYKSEAGVNIYFSAVTALLQLPEYRPTTSDGNLYYEMWRLSGKDAEGRRVGSLKPPLQAFGSILFGADKNGWLTTQWDRKNQWVQII